MDKYREARKICQKLCSSGYPTMMAGGCVRDRLFGHEPNDYDLATSAKPEQVQAFAARIGLKTIPVGLSHGTVSLVTTLQQLEITTLRHDVSCDGRHATVTFSGSFREDALRRDFTINALYEDYQGQVHDHVGGLADMEAHCLRFVGEASDRIREDYLRILRYFRFLGRLGWQARPDQLDAVKATRSGLLCLSAERIQRELTLTWASNAVSEVVRHMTQSGVLHTLFPWFHESSATQLGCLLATLAEAPPIMHWFAFFRLGRGRQSEPSLKLIISELRFSRRDSRLLLALDQFVDAAESPLEAALSLLRLARHDLARLPQLAGSLLRHHTAFGFTPAGLLDPLLEGLLLRAEPTIPPAALMLIQPKERGDAIDLVKIYWYLGACHDKNHIEWILSRSQYFRQLLETEPYNLITGRALGALTNVPERTLLNT